MSPDKKLQSSVQRQLREDRERQDRERQAEIKAERAKRFSRLGTETNVILRWHHQLERGRVLVAAAVATQGTVPTEATQAADLAPEPQAPQE